MIGNFHPGYIASTFYPAGYFDSYNVDTSEFEGQDGDKRLEKILERRLSCVKSSGSTTTYDLLFKPPSGILNSTKPLLPKTEMIISFDRASSELALLSKATDGLEPLAGKVIELQNVFLSANYYTSPYLRNYFDSITKKDISYKYDEVAVYHKNLPQGTSIIRMSNIIGGNTPSYLFAGIIESSALNGNVKKSSTAFKRHGVTEFDLTLDGYSVQGFPLSSEDESPIMVYDKFLKTTNRKFVNTCAEQISAGDFQQFHYLYAHKFVGETSETGWLGINLKLEQAYEENYTMGIFFIFKTKNKKNILVIWTSHEVDLRIDQFRRIEKIIL